MSQTLWTITVPTKDNDGQSISNCAWQSLEGRLLNAAGGFSKILIRGSWISDDGIRFDDSSYRYEMLTDNGHGILTSQIDDIANFVKAMWQQETVLITETETRFQFV